MSIRSWGRYIVLWKTSDVKIKYIRVKINRLIFVIFGKYNKLSSFQSAKTSFQKNVIVKIDMEKNDK